MGHENWNIKGILMAFSMGFSCFLQGNIYHENTIKIL